MLHKTANNGINVQKSACLLSITVNGAVTVQVEGFSTMIWSKHFARNSTQVILRDARQPWCDLNCFEISPIEAYTLTMAKTLEIQPEESAEPGLRRFDISDEELAKRILDIRDGKVKGVDFKEYLATVRKNRQSR